VLPADVRRSVRPVAGKDYWDKTAARRYLSQHVFQAVLIERASADSSDRAAASRQSVERMADEIARRHSLIVFPEGTRGVDRGIGRFKSGLYHLCRLRPDVELIPVYLENLNRILPKGEILPLPVLSRVVFGSPLAIGVTEDKQDFLSRMRDALIQLRGSHDVRD
jgi:1-acyl-sn-glycerol-3-phosphate acyltransferase